MDFRHAVNTHIKLQTGCYINERIAYGRDIEYIYSRFANDIVWNRAFVFSDDASNWPIEWVVSQARDRERTPAVVHLDHGHLESVDSISIASQVQERWMLCTRGSFKPADDVKSATIHVTEDPVPPEAFLDIFVDLFKEDEINKFFAENYVRALANATQGEAKVFHLIAEMAGHSISCASIYILGDDAGLYNVGTRCSSQKKGLGSFLSRKAVELALDAGAKNVVLQCGVGTHVERLYKEIGFTKSVAPTVYTLAQNG